MRTSFYTQARVLFLLENLLGEGEVGRETEREIYFSLS